MTDPSIIGRWIILAGLLLVAVGGLILLLSRLRLPFGGLPGDFHFEGSNLTCFAPVVSMLVLSLLLTLILNLALRFLNR